MSSEYLPTPPGQAAKMTYETLMVIIGEPLSDMWRYAGYQRFEFGVQRPFINRKGKAVTIADWALVVNCDWEIVRSEEIIVCSKDFGSGSDGRRDARAHPFYNSLRENGPIVRKVLTTSWGGITVRMSEGYRLHIRPLLSDEDEQWRFFPVKVKSSHLVLDADRLEWHHVQSARRSSLCRGFYNSDQHEAI